jgi:dihydroxyacid dehydratase/phosphogluconate dehydratase
LVKNNDEIIIDITKVNIVVNVPKSELNKRKKKCKPIRRPHCRIGALVKYASLVTSA